MQFFPLFIIFIDNDLREVLESTIDVTEWKLLGDAEMDYRKALDQQREMLVTWISSGNASWRKLVEALLSPLIHNDKVASEIELAIIHWNEAVAPCTSNAITLKWYSLKDVTIAVWLVSLAWPLALASILENVPTWL